MRGVACSKQHTPSRIALGYVHNSSSTAYRACRQQWIATSLETWILPNHYNFKYTSAIAKHSRLRMPSPMACEYLGFLKFYTEPAIATKLRNIGGNIVRPLHIPLQIKLANNKELHINRIIAVCAPRMPSRMHYRIIVFCTSRRPYRSGYVFVDPEICIIIAYYALRM